MIDETAQWGKQPDSPAARAGYVERCRQLTRAAFDSLPADDRAAILATLRAIDECGDQRRAYRDDMGCLIRGARAHHVADAGAELRRLGRPIPAPVDNTPAGRLARLRQAATDSELYAALAGATIADLREIVWGSSGWKRDRHIANVIDHVLAARGMDATPAGRLARLRAGLAVRDLVESMTVADMRAVCDLAGWGTPRRKSRHDWTRHTYDSADAERRANRDAARTAEPAAAPEPFTSSWAGAL